MKLPEANFPCVQIRLLKSIRALLKERRQRERLMVFDCGELGHKRACPLKPNGRVMACYCPHAPCSSCSNHPHLLHTHGCCIAPAVLLQSSRGVEGPRTETFAVRLYNGGGETAGFVLASERVRFFCDRANK